MPRRTLKPILQLESTSGILLMLATLIALICANTPIAAMQEKLLNQSLFWINDGLMAVFFLAVTLELKREFIAGELSPVSRVILPLAAALGGMLVPVLIYIAINYANPIGLKGWAIPVATDIAFALGVLSLFGKRVPKGLKLYLLALAIFDDLGAICIIAIFYTSHISYLLLFRVGVLVYILFLFNRLRVYSLIPYLLLGGWLWLMLVPSGIHPTLAGVFLGFMIPMKKQQKFSPLHRLENGLQPIVAYGIMPLFALANAGFSFSGLTLNQLTDGVTLGIIAGLVIGKELGVFGFSWILIKTGFASLPLKTSWLALYGVAIICGIGFTMSLFLGTLSFQNENSILLTEVRLGVIVGSIVSGLIGVTVLRKAFSH